MGLQFPSITLKSRYVSILSGTGLIAQVKVEIER